jgi:hypothetical protein
MAGLQNVANHLSTHARKLGPCDAEADAFGRSAFNRHYYATFLTVRELLISIDEAWARTPHAEIPERIERNLVALIKDTAKRQVRSRALDAGRSSSIVRLSISAATEIASVLKSAYTIRVAADYEPSHKIVFGATGIELDSCSIGEASSWCVRVEREKWKLIVISKELGLVS